MPSVGASGGGRGGGRRQAAAARTGSPGPSRTRSLAALDALAEAVAGRAAADAQILEAVRSARAEGEPWRAVAEVLGVSAAAAHKRFSAACGGSSSKT